MEFLAAYNYPHPIPGEIITAIVIASLATWALAVAYINFGPGATPPAD